MSLPYARVSLTYACHWHTSLPYAAYTMSLTYADERAHCHMQRIQYAAYVIAADICSVYKWAGSEWRLEDLDAVWLRTVASRGWLLRTRHQRTRCVSHCGSRDTERYTAYAAGHVALSALHGASCVGASRCVCVYVCMCVWVCVCVCLCVCVCSFHRALCLLAKCPIKLCMVWKGSITQNVKIPFARIWKISIFWNPAIPPSAPLSYICIYINKLIYIQMYTYICTYIYIYRYTNICVYV